VIIRDGTRIEHALEIMRSDFMPISDIFPKAGITFWDCAHEGFGGMIADGHTRASAAAQINMPRDFWTQVIDLDLPEVVEFERPSDAEKRSSRLWHDDTCVGTEFDEGVSCAGIDTACGLKGNRAHTMADLTDALNTAITDQMQNGATTLIEAIMDQELGAPFRRDAMKAPVAVAGIDPGGHASAKCCLP
jgi:thiamine pyrophosphate-dependent acetolactate synthase large subunit-like protein